MDEDEQRSIDVIARHITEQLRPATVLDVGCGRAGDTVIATAATPGQGGSGHVNEQPHGYWIDKFARRGFHFDEARSNEWRRAWERANVLPWYCKNVLIFERAH